MLHNVDKNAVLRAMINVLHLLEMQHREVADEVDVGELLKRVSLCEILFVKNGTNMSILGVDDWHRWYRDLLHYQKAVQADQHTNGRLSQRIKEYVIDHENVLAIVSDKLQEAESRSENQLP